MNKFLLLVSGSLLLNLLAGFSAPGFEEESIADGWMLPAAIDSGRQSITAEHKLNGVQGLSVSAGEEKEHLVAAVH